MNLIEKICRDLGVEMGEMFLATDGLLYKIESEQLYMCNEGGDWIFATIPKHIKLLTGEIEPMWTPQEGETYYTPKPTIAYRFGRCEKNTWTNQHHERWALRNNMVFKTAKEAIEAANKMIEAIKEED